MSGKGNKMIIYISSIISLIGAFVIIGRDAIFGDASLTEIDFTFFFVILVPIIMANITMTIIMNQKSKEKN